MSTLWNEALQPDGSLSITNLIIECSDCKGKAHLGEIFQKILNAEGLDHGKLLKNLLNMKSVEKEAKHIKGIKDHYGKE